MSIQRDRNDSASPVSKSGVALFLSSTCGLGLLSCARAALAAAAPPARSRVLIVSCSRSLTRSISMFCRGSSHASRFSFNCSFEFIFLPPSLVLNYPLAHLLSGTFRHHEAGQQTEHDNVALRF